MALWCSEEHLATETRLQEALSILEGWTKRSFGKINPRKTTYTIFSLSRNRRPNCISMVGLRLPRTTPPTWELLSTSHWLANSKLRKLNPEPRCDLPSWKSWQVWHGVQILCLSVDCTLVESDQYLSMTWQHGTLQPCPTLIGSAKYRARQPTSSQGSAIKSIVEPETTTGLQSLDDRKDLKLLNQAAKLKRLQDHPVRQRLSQPTKGRLTKGSFIKQSRTLGRRQGHPWSWPQRDSPLPPHVLPFLPGVRELLPSFGVPSLALVTKAHKAALRDSRSLWNTFKPTTHKSAGLMCTHGSDENTVRNGGTGVHIQYPGGKEDKPALLPAYTTKTMRLKQKSWKQEKLIFMPCPSRRPSNKIGTLTATTCLLLLPPFSEAMQSPCNELSPTATCIATRLLTLWQKITTKEQVDMSTGNLRGRPFSQPSSTASGGSRTHGTRLTPATCLPSPYVVGAGAPTLFFKVT